MLKIDRTLLKAAQIDPKVLERAAELADSVGAQCVVEGVETLEQAEIVTTAGINLVRGFLYGKPGKIGDHF